MTYDNWKTTDPRDSDQAFGGDEPYECMHEETEINRFTMRETCLLCGDEWSTTAEAILTRDRIMHDAARFGRRAARHEWWQRKTYPLRMKMSRLLERINPRWSLCPFYDDEIPF